MPPTSDTKISDEVIADMQRIDNSGNPIVTPIGKITSSWSSHVLEKDNRKYSEWAHSMKLELSMVQLWEYIFDPIIPPHQTYQPRAFRAWTANNRLACSFVKRAILQSEQKLSMDIKNPIELWTYLKGRHGGAVPVKQVRLLQEALTTRCSQSEPLTKTVDKIYDLIDRAFDAGEVTKELLKSIAVLSSLTEKEFAHICLIISRDLGNATEDRKYGPEDIRQYIEGEQTLLDGDKGGPGGADDTTPTAYNATKTSRNSAITCARCKTLGQPVQVYTGHTAPWYILEGGGMAGKTLEESRKARLAHYDTLRKDKATKPQKATKLTVTPQGGTAFTIEGDADTINAYLTTRGQQGLQTAGFIGLAADSVPTVSTIAEVKNLEFDAWIAFEEELKTSVDWNKFTKHDPTIDSALSCQDQTREPFYLDSGATVHISPDATDFISLTPIQGKPIRGVGGSSIAATGYGTIRIYVAAGTYMELHNALLVPESTVRLLSIYKLARQLNVSTTFDEAGATLN